MIPSSENRGTTLSAVMLIAGTCIGAGMLALPLVTGLAGFWPALAMNIACWAFMLATGLLFLEATLWMEDGANVLSMAERFLGPIGKLAGGVSFLFLYYCLMVAYLAGGAPLFTSFIETSSGYQLSHQVSTCLFGLLFGSVVLLGTTVIDRVNTLLMGGLILSYILMIGLGSGEVDGTLLQRGSWAMSLWALPTLFAAFGYHNIIPSLCSYLRRDEKSLRHGIILGTLIPLVAYTLWQWLVIGAVSEQELKEAAQAGTPVSVLLKDLDNPWIGKLALFFSFFAIVTSLLGVAMSMVDFLGDGLKIQRRDGMRRLGLCLAIFVPAAVIAASNPRIFLDALAYAGGFGEAILNGFLPIAMVWVGRYRLGLQSRYRLPGGRATLCLLGVMTVVVFVLEIIHAFGR